MEDSIDMEKTEAGRLPQHVAIILDGNGRWAAANGKRRSQGHRAGADNVETIGDAMIERGIPYLTVYAFSTENWNRSQEEVSYLMGLMKQYLIRNKKDALRKGIRIRVLGDRSRLSPELQHLIADMEEATADMKNLSLQFAINYGGRDEIVRAVPKDCDRGSPRRSEAGRNRCQGVCFLSGYSRSAGSGSDDPDQRRTTNQ